MPASSSTEAHELALGRRAGPPAGLGRRGVVMTSGVGVYLAVVQFFFALTWTVYVIFLPALAAQVGIPGEVVIWVLMLDQLVFVLSDYAFGVAGDRAAKVVGRLGRL